MTSDQAKMGQRLRELRLARGLHQGEVARRLDISPAYLSLLEKGKRALQLPHLFKALEIYGVTIEDFMQSLGERRVDDGLARLLDEPLFRSLNLSEEDIAGLGSEPKIVTTITALFNLYKTTRSQLDNVLASFAPNETGGAETNDTLHFDHTPFDEVTDFLEKNANWFPSLEERALSIRRDHHIGVRVTSSELVRALREGFQVDVRMVDPEGHGSVVRSWEPERNLLTLSSGMFEQRLKFQLAHAIALRVFDVERSHQGLAAGHPARHAETYKLIKIHLANYLAGAILLPYDDFHREVTRTRYDVELLTHVFESSYETVAHRLCNLADPKQRGVPFHFLRVDVAGNISKRYSATGLRFPHGYGSCPKTAVHLAFLTPTVITRQYEVHPDGTTYFAFGKVVSEPRRGSLARGTVYAIGLGTHADNAKHLAYADDLPFADPSRMAVRVGVTCRLCERTDCNQRAAPSYKFAFRVDEHTKKDNFFSPLMVTAPKTVKAG